MRKIVTKYYERPERSNIRHILDSVSISVDASTSSTSQLVFVIIWKLAQVLLDNFHCFDLLKRFVLFRSIVLAIL